MTPRYPPLRPGLSRCSRGIRRHRSREQSLDHGEHRSPCPRSGSPSPSSSTTLLFHRLVVLVIVFFVLVVGTLAAGGCRLAVSVVASLSVDTTAATAASATLRGQRGGGLLARWPRGRLRRGGGGRRRGGYGVRRC